MTRFADGFKKFAYTDFYLAAFAAIVFTFLYLFTEIPLPWLIFVAAGVFEVLIIFWFVFRKVK